MRSTSAQGSKTVLAALKCDFRSNPINGRHQTARLVRLVPQDSDVPSQALSAQLIALLLPCWLEGLGYKIVQG